MNEDITSRSMSPSYIVDVDLVSLSFLFYASAYITKSANFILPTPPPPYFISKLLLAVLLNIHSQIIFMVHVIMNGSS